MKCPPGGWYVVTGGSSGIGLATVSLLRHTGCLVANVSRSRPANDRGTADVFVQADLSDLGTIGELRERLGRHGVDRVRGCFLAAGGGAFAKLEHADAQTSAAMAANNLVSPYLCIGAVRPLLATNASIVLCGSAVARSKVAGGGLYAAAKAGLESLTKTLASELGPQVRVNCVSPGAIETPLYAKLGLDLDVIKSAISPGIPLRRFGTPEEVANVVVFLLSEAASYVSGAVIDVHGGGLPEG